MAQYGDTGTGLNQYDLAAAIVAGLNSQGTKKETKIPLVPEVDGSKALSQYEQLLKEMKEMSEKNGVNPMSSKEGYRETARYFYKRYKETGKEKHAEEALKNVQAALGTFSEKEALPKQLVKWQEELSKVVDINQFPKPKDYRRLRDEYMQQMKSNGVGKLKTNATHDVYDDFQFTTKEAKTLFSSLKKQLTSQLRQQDAEGAKQTFNTMQSLFTGNSSSKIYDSEAGQLNLGKQINQLAQKAFAETNNTVFDQIAKTQKQVQAQVQKETEVAAKQQEAKAKTQAKKKVANAKQQQAQQPTTTTRQATENVPHSSSTTTTSQAQDQARLQAQAAQKAVTDAMSELPKKVSQDFTQFLSSGQTPKNAAQINKFLEAKTNEINQQFNGQMAAKYRFTYDKDQQMLHKADLIYENKKNGTVVTDSFVRPKGEDSRALIYQMSRATVDAMTATKNADKNKAEYYKLQTQLEKMDKDRNNVNKPIKSDEVNKQLDKQRSDLQAKINDLKDKKDSVISRAELASIKADMSKYQLTARTQQEKEYSTTKMSPQAFETAKTSLGEQFKQLESKVNNTQGGEGSALAKSIHNAKEELDKLGDSQGFGAFRDQFKSLNAQVDTFTRGMASVTKLNKELNAAGNKEFALNKKILDGTATASERSELRNVEKTISELQKRKEHYRSQDLIDERGNGELGTATGNRTENLRAYAQDKVNNLQNTLAALSGIDKGSDAESHIQQLQSGLEGLSRVISNMSSNEDVKNVAGQIQTLGTAVNNFADNQNQLQSLNKQLEKLYNSKYQLENKINQGKSKETVKDNANLENIKSQITELESRVEALKQNGALDDATTRSLAQLKQTNDDQTVKNNQKAAVKDLKGAYDDLSKSVKEYTKVVLDSKSTDDMITKADKNRKQAEEKVKTARKSLKENIDDKNERKNLKQEGEDKVTTERNLAISKAVQQYQDAISRFENTNKNTNTPEFIAMVANLRAELEKLANAARNADDKVENLQNLGNFGKNLNTRFDSIKQQMSGLNQYAKIDKLLAQEDGKDNKIEAYKKLISESRTSLDGIRSEYRDENGILFDSNQLEEERNELDQLLGKIQEIRKDKAYTAVNKNGGVMLNGSIKEAGDLSKGAYSVKDMEQNLQEYAHACNLALQGQLSLSSDGKKLSGVFKDSSDNLRKLTASVESFSNGAKGVRVATTDLGKSTKFVHQLGDGFKEMGSWMLHYFTGYQMITKFFREFRQGLEVFKEYDKSLTTMKYTMDLTQTGFDNLGQSAINMAKDLKTSISNATSVYEIYANMKTTAEDMNETARPTLMLANATGQNASTAADQIQAVQQQFKIDPSQSEHIADVYEQISANLALDFSTGIEGMAAAVKNSGAVARDAGMKQDLNIQKCIFRTHLIAGNASIG